MMDSAVVNTPFALPSTCSVSALVYRVTCTPHYVKSSAMIRQYFKFRGQAMLISSRQVCFVAHNKVGTNGRKHKAQMATDGCS